MYRLLMVTCVLLMVSAAPGNTLQCYWCVGVHCLHSGSGEVVDCTGSCYTMAALLDDGLSYLLTYLLTYLFYTLRNSLTRSKYSKRLSTLRRILATSHEVVEAPYSYLVLANNNNNNNNNTLAWSAMTNDGRGTSV